MGPPGARSAPSKDWLASQGGLPRRSSHSPLAGWLNRRLAGLLQWKLSAAAVRLQLWDGTSLYGGAEPPTGTLRVADARTLRGLVFNPHLQFGEAYMAGRLDVEGELTPVLEAVSRLSLVPSLRERIAVRLPLPNSLSRARRNVHHHYDLGNDFYQGWLDEQLVYTCAYFEHPQVSLEEAQRAKLDLVCRKLRLQPGETVVEAGCGWGALALHMARAYGVRVRAFNVSREQIAYARERASREGLGGRVEFIDDDYRNVKGEYDAFVSVGMLEHVGVKHYESLARVLKRVLRREGGRGLLHFIGRDIARPLNAWIRRRIFPGAYPPTLAEVTTKVLGPARMSVLDVENLRLHYARTLAHWSRRFAAIEDRVRSRYGEEFRRAWELYLAGSEAAFLAGTLQLFQVVFSPAESAPPFLTRVEIYGGERADQWFAATR
ncbi:MAG: class I SAM-dependent methyltransferase [Acidobacteria bacterium]|nr:class I SAM-dependent methyltransferase [Acidobacteriota bacterium]